VLGSQLLEDPPSDNTALTRNVFFKTRYSERQLPESMDDHRVSNWQQDSGSAVAADQVCHLQRRTIRLWLANSLEQQRPPTGWDPR